MECANAGQSASGASDNRMSRYKSSLLLFFFFSQVERFVRFEERKTAGVRFDYSRVSRKGFYEVGFVSMFALLRRDSGIR